MNKFVGKIPIAGICLGQQIIVNELGGTIEKLSFGHRCVKQPVMDVSTGKVVITTKNHSYNVLDGGELEVTHRNVNDDTIEGLESEILQIKKRQYHPETNPGPRYSLSFFKEVMDMCNNT
jgi:carbamoyl-phosphate synthase small subunit